MRLQSDVHSRGTHHIGSFDGKEIRMGKPTGFLEYERKEAKAVSPKERIKNFNEFHTPLSEAEQRCQSARCMDCGVPFCQSGMNIKGMTSGCPLNNLIPEWNDLVYTGNWEQAYNRLHKTSNFPEFTFLTSFWSAFP